MISSLSRCRAFVGAALVAIALSACGPARTLPPEDTEPVRIGLIVPLSGELGADGPSWRDSVRVAVREVNAAGGVLPGRPVELFIENSESTAEQGVASARRLVDDEGVVAIIGDAASGSTIAIYEMVTHPAGVILGSGLSTSPILTEINEAHLAAGEPISFFRTVPPDDGQYTALAGAMYDRACRSISILYADNDYGTPFFAGVRFAFEQLGGVVTPRDGVPFTEGLSEYRAQVDTVAAALPDCIALIAYPQSAGIIVNNWAALAAPPPVRWFGTDGIRQPGFATEVGNAMLIDGFLGTSPLTEPMSPAYNRFRAQYEAAFGSMPVAFTSTLYDATALMLLGIAKAGTDRDPDAIWQAILELNDPGGTVVQAGELAEGLRLVRAGRPMNYEGASGPVVILPNGDVEGVFELWRFDATSATEGTFVTDTILN
ncbi:MAG: ABC transporter substrate-binding protein [Myxococcota bacterium]|nr:ABC transporter substrate-binding protein [Myxococcota bacterium]